MLHLYEATSGARYSGHRHGRYLRYTVECAAEFSVHRNGVFRPYASPPRYSVYGYNTTATLTHGHPTRRNSGGASPHVWTYYRSQVTPAREGVNPSILDRSQLTSLRRASSRR